MGTIIVLVIILACILQQVFFGSLVRSFAILMSAVIGMFVALAFFEPLGQKFVESDFMAWRAHGLVIGLMFVVSFGILLALSLKFLSGDVAISMIVDRAGGSVIAILTGLVISGTLLIAMNFASVSNSFPYQRFSPADPDIDTPRKVLLNPDGFVAGMFGLASSGSLGQNSFALVRAGINDTAALGRLSAEKEISPIAGKNVIRLPAVLRYAPPGITDAEGKTLPENPGNELVLLRLNMTKSVVGKDSANFLLGQLRIVCKKKDDRALPNEGSGICVYPAGYMKTSTRVALEPLSAQVPLASAELDEGVKAIDFAFYVPADIRPVLIEFKRNYVTAAPPVIGADEGPAVVGYDSVRGAPAPRPAPGAARDPNAPR